MWVSVNNYIILQCDQAGSWEESPGSISRLKEHLDQWSIFPITAFGVPCLWTHWSYLGDIILVNEQTILILNSCSCAEWTVTCGTFIYFMLKLKIHSKNSWKINSFIIHSGKKMKVKMSMRSLTKALKYSS